MKSATLTVVAIIIILGVASFLPVFTKCTEDSLEPGCTRVDFWGNERGVVVFEEENTLLGEIPFPGIEKSEVEEQNSGDTFACTQEARICPDGTAVGRTGPNCEFAECSGNKNHGLDNCFVGEALASNVDRSEWATFEGFGFAIKYPSQSLNIQLFGSPYNSGEFHYEISSATVPHKADIRVYRLRKEIFRADYLHTANVLYELYSNTWWKDERIWDSSMLDQCNPNELGKTNSGKYSIYLTRDGDVGAFFMKYFVVLRDVEKSDNYEPLIIEFTTNGDGNNPNYSTYPAFQDILENIIRTIELRPTSKG